MLSVRRCATIDLAIYLRDEEKMPAAGSVVRTVPVVLRQGSQELVPTNIEENAAEVELAQEGLYELLLIAFCLIRSFKV